MPTERGWGRARGGLSIPASPSDPQASRHGRQSTQDPACTPPRPLRTIRDAYQFGGPVSSFLEFAGVPAPPGDG